MQNVFSLIFSYFSQVERELNTDIESFDLVCSHVITKKKEKLMSRKKGPVAVNEE